MSSDTVPPEVRAAEKEIDSAFRSNLLVQLSFREAAINPADPREIHERSEEIGRGIGQITRRRLLSSEKQSPLLYVLGIGSDYGLSWGVASETSIGAGWVQDESVPVIQAAHFVRRLVALGSLKAACAWLASREYLPVEGRDYETVDVTTKIGGWTLDWHGLRGLGALGGAAQHGVERDDRPRTAARALTP